MNQQQLREVLDRLSRGEITTEQADDFLSGRDEPEAARPEPDTSADVDERGSAPVTVQAAMNGSGQLRVVGATIPVPTVTGPASAQVDRNDRGFVVAAHFAAGTELAVPAGADLELEVNGSDVELRGLTGTLDARLNVGEIRLDARLAHGASMIHANAGPLIVNLAAGSDVRVLLRAGCQWAVDPRIVDVGAGEWILGQGRATLIIEGNLGHLELNGPAGE